MMTGFQTRDICFPILAEQSCAVWHPVSHKAALHTATKGAGCSSFSHATNFGLLWQRKDLGQSAGSTAGHSRT